MKHIARSQVLVGALVLTAAVSMLAVPAVASSPSPSALAPASPWSAQSVVIVQLSDQEASALTPDQLTAAEAVIRARFAAYPGALVAVTAIPDDRLRVELADATTADAIAHVATAHGDLQFVPVPDAYAGSVTDGEPLPSGMPVEPLFGGDSVTSVAVGVTQTDLPAVDIVLDPDAATLFDEYAAAHYGERFAIVLDGTVIEAPTINATRFNGSAQISGAFDLAQVQQLVAILTGGVLPVHAVVLQVCPAASECSQASPAPSPAA
jgi:preprotein translocase subunit SecD